MRNPSRAILLAILMASLILPPGLPVAGAAKVDPAAATGAKRIMLVGDSLAIGLGQQLETVLAKSPGVTFTHLGKVSSGLANPAFFNWDTRLTAMVKEQHPDVVMLMFGANDDKPLPGEGRSLPFGSPGWDKAYTARLVRMTAIIRADNPKAKIFFLGVPVMADQAFNARMTHVNGVLAAMTRTVPDCAFIRTTDVLADAAGAFAAKGRHADGSLVKLRADDGVHISGTGSRLLAGRCIAAIAEAAGLPGPRLVASLEDRDVLPVAAAPASASLTASRETKPTAPAKPASVAAATPKAAPATKIVPVAAVSAKPVTPAKFTAGIGAAGKPALSGPATVAAADTPAKSAMTKPTAPVKPVEVATAAPKAAPVTAPAPKPVPVAVAPAKPAPAAGTAGYTVADGDSFWSVAKRLGVSPEDLAQANPGVDSRRLSIGQSLSLPAGGVRLAQAAPAPAAPVASASRTHVVSEGDNFWAVARHYEVSVAALTQANPGVEPTRLHIGQTLAIPAAGSASAVAETTPTTARGYTVADGDNFWSIAHRLGLDIAEFKRANANVDPLRLRPGQVLALPGSASVSGGQAQAPTATRENRIAGDAGLYPVAPGDTLWSLSRRFGVRLDTMLSANGELDPIHLQVGQLVTIPGAGQPVASAESLVFPVSAGDTLWGIARRFDVSVEAILAANPGIDPLRLREGQTVRVPSSLAAVASPALKPEQTQPLVSGDQTGKLHSVVTGDTLWHLARRFGVSLEALLQENAGIDPVHLQVGQSVRLPGSVVSMAAR